MAHSEPLVDDAGQHLRPADVDADDAPVGHGRHHIHRWQTTSRRRRRTPASGPPTDLSGPAAVPPAQRSVARRAARRCIEAADVAPGAAAGADRGAPGVPPGGPAPTRRGRPAPAAPDVLARRALGAHGARRWVGLSVVLFLISAQFLQDGVDGATKLSCRLPARRSCRPRRCSSSARTCGRRAHASPARRRAGAGARTRSSSCASAAGTARSSRSRATRWSTPRLRPEQDQRRLRARRIALAVKTCEYLGIDVDHVILVNFDKFPELVDAMGGISYTGGCVVSRINGGFATAATRCACAPARPTSTASRRWRSRARARTSATPARTSYAPAPPAEDRLGDEAAACSRRAASSAGRGSPGAPRRR